MTTEPTCRICGRTFLPGQRANYLYYNEEEGRPVVYLEPLQLWAGGLGAGSGSP